MSPDVALQLALFARLVFAAVLGAVIGLERERHDHPAGMRTHLLVSVGSAAFTVLSIEAFQSPGADPARIAAQIVTGVGFLGAGAILKEGATIRGLTTAASLWAVAAVGMAAGAGAWGVALAITLIVLISLWPLRVVTERYVGPDEDRILMRLTADDPAALGRLFELVASHRATVAHLATSAAPAGGQSIEIEIRTRSATESAAIIAAILGLDGLTVTESKATPD